MDQINLKPLCILSLDGFWSVLDSARNYRKEFLLTRIIKFLSENFELLVFSDRSDELKNQMIEWFLFHTQLPKHQIQMMIMVRLEDENRTTEQLKMNWYNMLSYNDRKRVVAIFEDDDKMVSVWHYLNAPAFKLIKGSSFMD